MLVDVGAKYSHIEKIMVRHYHDFNLSLLLAIYHQYIVGMIDGCCVFLISIDAKVKSIL